MMVTGRTDGIRLNVFSQHQQLDVKIQKIFTNTKNQHKTGIPAVTETTPMDTKNPPTTTRFLLKGPKLCIKKRKEKTT